MRNGLDLFIRKVLYRQSKLFAFFLLCICLGFAHLSLAQDLQFLQPTHGQQSYLQVEGVRSLKAGEWNLSAYMHYGRDPLLLVEQGDVKEVLVRYITTAELVAAFALHDRVELGIALPYSFTPGVNGNYPVDDAQGLGDLRLNPKFVILRPKNEQSFGLALNLMSILPTGSQDREPAERSYVRRNFSSHINLAMEYFYTQSRVAINLGYRIRPLRGDFDVLTDLDISSGPTWGIGYGYTIAQDLELSAEAFQRFMSYERSPIETMFALRSTRKGAFNAHFGLGTGLGGDFSSVGLRILGGITYTPQPDKAGGVPLTDSDGDGLIDIVDRCPKEPEDRDGIEDFDGCPEDDVDRDGIKDEVDRCPQQAEDLDQFQDEDGCPELDNDKDGIPDTVDRCPNQAEVFNQIDDTDGCPDKKPVVEEEGELIGLSEKIFFKHNESIILRRSFTVLEQVAKLIKQQKQIKKVRIEGHTDDTGGVEFNLNLSKERADAVKMHLVGLGVEIDRLESAGYGDQRPIASNDTDKGRALNRRVDFRIVDGPQEIFKVESRPKTSKLTVKKSTPSTLNRKLSKPSTSESNSSKGSQVSHAVQVKASYRLQDAEKIRSQIEKERFPVYILSIKQDNGQMIHRVRVGPYASRNLAKQALQAYQDRFPESSGEYVVKLSKSEASKYR
ncbi:MAG: hypothetical protein CMH49_07110 [Myxococcales bacterium]|nr:hypothetical protein [Myxococcales bacterium]